MRDHDKAADTNAPDASGSEQSDDLLDAADYQERAMELTSSYVEAIETAPMRLYDPERQEVHTGLVARAARVVVTALGYPDLWCAEQGSHVGRTLTETRILLEWMATQESTIYQQFKDYGAGKAKLYSLIMEEIPSEWLTSGVSDSVDELRRVSHNDEIVDHRVVDVSSSFAGGKSLRDMASECGLLDLYRHAYQLASGITHSEWWSIELMSMERCLNVLHRGHLIPSLSLPAGGSDELAQAWLTALYGLIRASLSILGTSEESVANAFAWLTEDGGEDHGTMPSASADNEPTD